MDFDIFLFQIFNLNVKKSNPTNSLTKEKLSILKKYPFKIKLFYYSISGVNIFNSMKQLFLYEIEYLATYN